MPRAPRRRAPRPSARAPAPTPPSVPAPSAPLQPQCAPINSSEIRHLSVSVLPIVQWNHEILKQRLTRLHQQWLKQTKLATERAPEFSRVPEITFGHSIVVDGHTLSTFPLSRSALLDSVRDEPSTEYIDELVGIDDDAPSLSASSALSFNTQSQSNDSISQTSAASEARLGKRRRALEADVVRFMRGEEPSVQSDERARIKRWIDRYNAPYGEKVSQPVNPPTSSPVSNTAPSPTPTIISNGVKPRSSPSPTVLHAAISPPIAAASAICDDCGSRIESLVSQCSFCGYDPLESESGDDEAVKKRRKKRAAKLASLLASSAAAEKRAKVNEEMRILAETMTPW